jgi:copper(I)-binding protein
MIIEDPQTGLTAKIDSQNRIVAFAVSQQEDKQLNAKGEFNSLHFSVTPSGAGSYFWYLENLGTFDLAISEIFLSSTVATRVNLHKVEGIPSYVASVNTTITNRNLGSVKVPQISSKFDTNITSLTSKGILDFSELSTVNQKFTMQLASKIIIPQGKAVALQRVASTGAITCLIGLTKAS